MEKIPSGQGGRPVMKEWASFREFINRGWIVPGGTPSVNLVFSMDTPSTYGNPGDMSGQSAVAPALKHSGLGIASFALSMVSGVAMLGIFIFAGFMGMQMSRDLRTTVNQDAAAQTAAIQAAAKEHAPQMMVASILGLGAMLGEGLAFVLGVVSLFISGRKKIFGILGVVFSAVPGGLFLLLMIFSMVARAHAAQ